MTNENENVILISNVKEAVTRCLNDVIWWSMKRKISNNGGEMKESGEEKARKENDDSGESQFVLLWLIYVNMRSENVKEEMIWPIMRNKW